MRYADFGADFDLVPSSSRDEVVLEVQKQRIRRWRHDRGAKWRLNTDMWEKILEFQLHNKNNELAKTN